MRLQFYQFLIVVILPYSATLSNVGVGVCRIWGATGMAISCGAGSYIAGTATCVVGAPLTMGASCLAGIATTLAIQGGCAGGNAIWREGKEYYRFYRYLVKLNYFD